MNAASRILADFKPVAARLAVPGLAVFICSLCIVIRPIARLSETYAFLALTINTLFFFPGSTVGAQVELTVLGLVGCLIGIGWSSLFIRIGTVLNNRNEGEESSSSRVLGAFALTIIACLAGYVRSHSPRLTTGSRLALFHSIWLLTSEMGRTDLPPIVVLDLLYPTLFAAGSSLIARLLFPTTSVAKFLDLTQVAFRTSERLLLSSVDDFFADTSNLSPEITNLRSLFIAQTRALPAAYDSCLYEGSFNKFAPYRLLPFLALIRRLKMDVAAGSSYSSARPPPIRRGSDATLGIPLEGRGAFQDPTVEFVKALVDSYAVIHKVLEGQSDDGMKGARERLTMAEELYRDEMDAKLELAVQRWEEKEKTSNRLDEELLQISLFAYYLRSVSQTLNDALGSARELSLHTNSKAQFRFPQLSRKWLGENSVTSTWDESARERDEPDNETISEPEHLRTEIETSVAEAFLGVGVDTVRVRNATFGTPRWFGFIFRRMWDSELAIQGRINLAKFDSNLKERRFHFQYAFKVGLGVILLSVPAFMPPGNSGRVWWLDSRGAWIPISYVYVLETTAGQTWRIGFYRALGTVSGSILGCIMWAISRGNPYALVVLTTCYGVLTALIMLFTGYPGVGIVASITIPPILYIPYLGLPHSSVIDIALKRTSDVCIGIAAAVLATEFIFPSHAKILFLSSVASALDDLTQLYLAMSRELLSAGDYNFDQSSSDKIERSIEITLGRCSAHLTSLRVEITLIHKPIRIYRRVIQSVQRLSDLLISIAVIREKIPREKTVTRVLQQRKDLVSSILVHLFACSHAFRSRLPLPQFLPSPREAVRQWEMKALEGLLAPEDRPTGNGDVGEVALLRSSSRENPGPLHRDAAFLYAFAEAQALEEVIKVVEEITELSRALFGSSTFFQDQREDKNRSPASPADP
ncbi:Fusaric acid resistance protein-like-domain-containing protein [Mrakia frigida]|uniref:Fusaric acid resistance protein-like-domain-containing protein n=1 Tax=Mrakia frigida TaxID=29902 RepID=UPI003FCC251D